MNLVKNLHYVNSDDEYIAIRLGVRCYNIYQSDVSKDSSYIKLVWGENFEYCFSPQRYHPMSSIYAYPSPDMQYIFVSYIAPVKGVVSMVLDAEGGKVTE